MTRPRLVLPQQNLMLTGRCHQRQFALRPDEDARQLFGYLLAVGTEKYGLDVLAATCMSDHYHLVAFDRDGQYPRFLQWFHSLLGRAVNRLRGRSDSLWTGKGPHVALLADDEALLDRMAYALANPVQDGAVAHGRDWPGFRTAPQACARRSEVFERPTFFFSAKSKLPKEAELRVVVPPAFERLDAGAFGGLLGRAVGEREERARAKMQAEGSSFMGVGACRSAAWEQHATRPEAKGAESAPDDVISRDAESGRRARERRDAFRASYDDARAQWLAGRRDTLWPVGTWQMVFRHGVATASPTHPPP